MFLLFLLLIFACAAVALVAAGWSYQRDRILPGVRTLGIPLGGQSVEEAAGQLETNWNARLVVLEDGDQHSFTLRLSELGILLDAPATARAAFRHGRDLTAPERVIQTVLDGAAVQPIWYFDPAVAHNSLQTIAPRLEVRPVNAGIEIVDARVQATPSLPGRQLDIEATVTWLQQNAPAVAFGEAVPLVVRGVEPEIADVSALVAELNSRIGAPISLRAFDPIIGETQNAEIPPEVWAGWLALDVDLTASNPQVNWRVDETQVAAFVQAQSEALGADRYFQLEPATADLVTATTAMVGANQEEPHEVRLRVFHRTSQHVVQSGETLSSIAFDYGIPYPWIQQINPNLGDGLTVGQSVTIPSPDEMIPLPVVENKRIVVSLEQQRMWVYENGALKWEWVVSTGIDSSPTAPGIFQIQSHEPNAYASIWDLWMPQFMGIYRPVPTSEFMNGFHGFPTRNGSNLLWTNSLGRKVTYGCILVSNDNIALLYDWAEEGVIVEVRP